MKTIKFPIDTALSEVSLLFAYQRMPATLLVHWSQVEYQVEKAQERRHQAIRPFVVGEEG